MTSCICYGVQTPQPATGMYRIINGESSASPAVLNPPTAFTPNVQLQTWFPVGTAQTPTTFAFPPNVGDAVDVTSSAGVHFQFVFSPNWYGTSIATLAPERDAGGTLITVKLPILPRWAFSNVWYMQWSSADIVTVGDYPNIGWALYGQPDVYFTQLDGLSAETRITTPTLLNANFMYVMNSVTKTYSQYSFGNNTGPDMSSDFRWTLSASGLMGVTTDGVVTIYFGGSYLNADGQYVNTLVLINL